MADPVGASPSRGSLKSYLLGGLICVQLVFIVLANGGSVALYFSRHDDAGVTRFWKTATEYISEPWAHATGQEQFWRMFAPAVPPRGAFVRVRIVEGGRVKEIPSEFESLGPHRIVHFPGSGERVWHAEKTLAMPFLIYDPVDIGERPDDWRAYLHNAINANRNRYVAFLIWKGDLAYKSNGDARVIDSVELLISLHTRSSHDRDSVPNIQFAVRWRDDGELEISPQNEDPK